VIDISPAVEVKFESIPYEIGLGNIETKILTLKSIFFFFFSHLVFRERGLAGRGHPCILPWPDYINDFKELQL